MSTINGKGEWGSDSPVSRPIPVKGQQHAEVVNLGGMVFGPMGLMLPATEAMVEARYTPQWLPKAATRRRDDGGADESVERGRNE